MTIKEILKSEYIPFGTKIELILIRLPRIVLLGQREEKYYPLVITFDLCPILWAFRFYRESDRGYLDIGPLSLDWER